MVTEFQLLISLLGGVIGGFGTKFLWNYYRRPVLDIRGVNIRKATNREGDITNAQYSVEIYNRGKSAASNCRARLHLEGRFDRTIDTAEIEALGDQEHVADGYEASYNLPWREGRNSESVTINRGETIEIELVTVDAGQDGPDSYIDLVFPQDPSRADDTGAIQKQKWGIDQGDSPVVEMVNRISREDFEQIPWQTMVVEFSGERTSMIRRQLQITWEQSVIPNINLN